jgi:hypothetical protein
MSSPPPPEVQQQLAVHPTPRALPRTLGAAGGKWGGGGGEGGQPQQAASAGRSVASDSVLSTRRASSLNSPARFVVRCELRGLALALAQQLTSDF